MHVCPACPRSLNERDLFDGFGHAFVEIFDLRSRIEILIQILCVLQDGHLLRLIHPVYSMVAGKRPEVEGWAIFQILRKWPNNPRSQLGALIRLPASSFGLGFFSGPYLIFHRDYAVPRSTAT